MFHSGTFHRFGADSFTELVENRLVWQIFCEPVMALCNGRNNIAFFIFRVKDLITTGAISFSDVALFRLHDVGAYFVGKNLKNKVGNHVSAAGAASPNKTIEGH
jgi:CDP-diglyceride synthetase